MSKRYKLQYNFKDGVSWGGKDVDVQLTADEIAAMLNQKLMNNPDSELTAQSSGETKTIKELKSIEILM